MRPYFTDNDHVWRKNNRVHGEPRHIGRVRGMIDAACATVITEAAEQNWDNEHAAVQTSEISR